MLPIIQSFYNRHIFYFYKAHKDVIYVYSDFLAGKTDVFLIRS